MADNPESTSNRSRIWWGIAVVAVVALALFLRVYWNVDAATDPEGGFRLASGSDPYYHKRAIDYIQDNGWTTLVRDPLLNYPYGSVNPNPPLFEWSVAATGFATQPFFGGDLETATWWAMLWSPAIWGALTAIPIYILGRELFGRMAGLLAAVFWALSTASMDHTSLGASDHDAFYLFFLVLGFAFYVKFIHAVRNDPNWVEKWSDGASVSSGLSAFFRARRVALGYAVLAGISLAAVALTWKGFPYATGIVFAYAGIQLVVDHWRNRDSTGLFAGTLLVMLLPVLLSMPYYAAAGVLSFLNPALYLVFAFLVAGFVLVPTRDMPSLLVMPLAALAAVVGLALTWVIPALESVRTQLLYATVYFKQSRLYTTIAEAHPSSFDDMVFSVGPVVFFCAILGLVGLLFTARKYPRRDTLFTFVWGVLAIFMAQSAVRFVFNAVPVLVILAGWLLAVAIAWLNYGALFDTRGSSVGSTFRRNFTVWHATGAVLIAVFLVAPNVLLAVDAAIPAEVEGRMIDERGADSFLGGFIDKRMGAFTQGFLPEYWEDGLVWLDQHDAGVAPEDRGAFLAWWDYGHWAIAVGNHPASADNFQNGYVHSGNFLAAENETHAVQLLAARSLERDLIDPATAKSLLGQAGVADVDATYAQMKKYAYAPGADLDQSVRFLDLVEKKCDEIDRPCRIRYVAADVRMLEYDSPQTPNIDKQGIFYAPLYLAEKNVSDYFETKFTGSDGLDYTQAQAERKVRASATAGGTPFQITGEHYEYKEPFFNSMFWRTYSGIPPRGGGPIWRGDALEEGLDGPQPGFGLQHFRLVYINEGLRILEYYPGAKVSGVVTEEGRPIAGAVVGALDDSGDLTFPLAGERTKSFVNDSAQMDVPHARAVTDAEGRFTIVAPFGMTRGVTFVVNVNGVESGRQTIQVTREQAATGADLGNVVSFDIKPGRVTGTAFFDTDGNGQKNVTEDVASNVTIAIGDQNVTTGPDGSYTIEKVPAGTRTVASRDAAYQVAAATRSVRINPGTTVTHDVGLVLRQATAAGHMYVDADGDGAGAPQEALGLFGYTIRVDTEVADNTAVEFTGVTSSAGNWTNQVTPGAYVLNMTYTTKEGVLYSISDRFTVPAGSVTFTRDFLFSKP